MLKILNICCTGFTYAAFAAVLVWLAITGNPMIIRLILTCGVSFVVLSVFRHFFNWPRPYEVYGIPPLVEKKTHGHSFPSRHVFSICVIGTSLLFILPALGILLFALGILLAAVRVLSGVHFLRYVLIGAVIGIFSGLIGFWMPGI